jgi:hypothetical protein
MQTTTTSAAAPLKMRIRPTAKENGGMLVIPHQCLPGRVKQRMELALLGQGGGKGRSKAALREIDLMKERRKSG